MSTATPTLPPELLALRPKPHPLAPPHTEAEAEAWMERFTALFVRANTAGAAPEHKASLRREAELLLARKQLIDAAVEDPLWHGIEPPMWRDQDAELARPEIAVQAVFGANRSTKTYRAIKRLCEAAQTYPGGFHAVLGEKEESSKTIQQPKIWEFLKFYIQHLNWKGRNNVNQKVRYTEADGFTNGKVIIPSGPVRDERGNIVAWEGTSTILINTYGSSAKDWEGIEWGAQVGKLKKRRDGTEIQNVAWVCDESANIDWLEMLVRRSRFRRAKGLWSFTPVSGITPAIKEMFSLMRILKTAPAKWLPQARIDGCPRGHMPLLAETVFNRARVSLCWVHQERNPMADYAATTGEALVGATTEHIERYGYGYARDTVGRQFHFQSYHICDPEDLPALGTDYQVIDYHAERPCFALWVRVSPGLEPDKPFLDVWADWPPAQQYGEWAVASDRELSADNRKGWDGERGPAQSALNFGYAEYKAAWLAVERVSHAGDAERDPKRRALQLQAQKLGRPLQMEIFERIIDSRAGPTKTLEDHGQTCPMEKFEEEHKDAETGEPLPPFYLTPADGRRHDWNMIRELLAVKRDEEGRLIGRPRLRIARGCEQVIWALNNFTGMSGEAGACKDAIDCLEYAARGELYHADERNFEIKSARECAERE